MVSSIIAIASRAGVNGFVDICEDSLKHEKKGQNQHLVPASRSNFNKYYKSSPSSYKSNLLL